MAEPSVAGRFCFSIVAMLLFGLADFMTFVDGRYNFKRCFLRHAQQDGRKWHYLKNHWIHRVLATKVVSLCFKESSSLVL